MNECVTPDAIPVLKPGGPCLVVVWNKRSRMIRLQATHLVFFVPQLELLVPVLHILRLESSIAVVKPREPCHGVNDDQITFFVVCPHGKKSADAHGINPNQLRTIMHALSVAVWLMQKPYPFRSVVGNMCMGIDDEQIVEWFSLAGQTQDWIRNRLLLVRL